MKSSYKDNRNFDQIKQHYEIEKKLADKLRNSSKKERKELYTSVYDEFFRRVPNLPQIDRKKDPIYQELKITSQINILKHFLNEESTFLEVGAGDCSLAISVAELVRKVYAIDVSNEITANSIQPYNFQLIISDGSNIPVLQNSVDIVYSNQLMEHLHPDDALDQLKHIYDALKTHGLYICSTPNKLSGPHDISKHFDSVATGFHLKEYTKRELKTLFKSAGFSRVQIFFSAKKIIFPALLPIFPFIMLENILTRVPNLIRQKISQLMIIRQLLDLTIIAKK